jgi:hypothetical protein
MKDFTRYFSRGSILPAMSQTKTERSNCRFTVKPTPEGRALLIVDLYHESIHALKRSVVGFDLLGGTSMEQAQKLAEALNERVLDIFVTSQGLTQ